MDFSKHLTIPGWCPVELMQLLNQEVSQIPNNQYYLEVGSFCGRSLAAALYGNTAKAYVIDPQDLIVGNTTSEILWNKIVNEFSLNERIALFKTKVEDFTGILSQIGVFFYDGNHDSGHTYFGLERFKRFLSNEAIIIVDDYLIYGGHSQTPYSGFAINIEHPVKTDVDKWISENKNNIVDIKYTPWLNGQAIIQWKK